MLESRLNFYIDLFYHTTPYVNNFNRNTQVEARVKFTILIVVGHSTKVWRCVEETATVVYNYDQISSEKKDGAFVNYTIDAASFPTVFNLSLIHISMLAERISVP